jgi:hypothetical protein
MTLNDPLFSLVSICLFRDNQNVSCPHTNNTMPSFLGHSPATTTLKVSTHVTEGMQKNAAETISNLIIIKMQ